VIIGLGLYYDNMLYFSELGFCGIAYFYGAKVDFFCILPGTDWLCDSRSTERELSDNIYCTYGYSFLSSTTRGTARSLTKSDFCKKSTTE
jgi:hypothetical protein